jgi:hypothetical protein
VLDLNGDTTLRPLRLQQLYQRSLAQVNAAKVLSKDNIRLTSPVRRHAENRRRFPPKAKLPIGPSLPSVSFPIGPVKHFLATLHDSLKRVFSSASFGVFPVGPDKYGSFVI